MVSSTIQGELQILIAGYRAALVNRNAALLQELATLFDAVQAEIEQLIIAAGPLRTFELITLREQIAQLVNDVHMQALPIAEKSRRFAQWSAASEIISMLDIQGIGVGLNVRAITNAIGSISGNTPLSRLFARASNDAQAAASEAFVTGVTLRENPLVIARRLEEELNISSARANTIARTEVMRSYREASQYAMQQSDSVVMWVWISGRSTNTCGECWAMDGQVFDTEESLDSHPNCECSMAPLSADSMVDLGNGPDIFDELSDSEQMAILGPGKFDAYQAGQIQLQDLVGSGTHPEWGAYRYEKSLASLGLG